MTESHFTRKLLRALRRTLPKSVIFKHADLFTAGVPDFSATFQGCTTWVEVKRYPATYVALGHLTIRPARDVTALQWETLYKLGRGYLVAYTPAGCCVTHVAGHRAAADYVRCRVLGQGELVKALSIIIENAKLNPTREDW